MYNTIALPIITIKLSCYPKQSYQFMKSLYSLIHFDTLFKQNRKKNIKYKNFFRPSILSSFEQAHTKIERIADVGRLCITFFFPLQPLHNLYKFYVCTDMKKKEKKIGLCQFELLLFPTIKTIPTTTTTDGKFFILLRENFPQF